MFINFKKLLAVVLFALAIVVWFQACSDVSLSVIEELSEVQQSVDTGFCLSPPGTRRVYNNILFVIDRSGSNAPHEKESGLQPGNDPSKLIRGTAIEDFYNTHKDNKFYRWSFIIFSGDNVSAYTNEGDPLVPVFTDSAGMDQAIRRFYTEGDDNGTDYEAALSLTETALQTDINKNLNKENEEHIYTVFFASDGRPMVAIDGKPVDRPITGPSDPRVLKIKQMTTLPARQVTLSTVYYADPEYPDDHETAIQGLKWMAEAGNGSFGDIGETGKISFKEMNVGEQVEAWRIKRMRLVVFNLNSASCENGKVGADSDADGICDEDEIAYNKRPYYRSSLGSRNFDPQNRNSVHNNFSDSFYWKFSLLPTGPGLSDCTLEEAQLDSDFDFLNACEEAIIHDEAANGPHSKWLIPSNNANNSNPDTDGDAYIDWIEFSWFRLDSAFSAPVNYTNIFDNYAPGVNAETLMSEHRHIMNPDKFIPSSYDTKLRFTGLNEKGQNCYTLNQKQLALYNTLEIQNKDQVSGYEDLVHNAGENKVLLYFIATPEQSPNDKGVYYYTIKTFDYGKTVSGNAANLQINSDLSEFKEYIISKEAPEK